MKISLNTSLDGHPPTLHCEPESSNDCVLLERLLREFVTAGFGRNQNTKLLMHLQIPITRKSTSGIKAIYCVAIPPEDEDGNRPSYATVNALAKRCGGQYQPAIGGAVKRGGIRSGFAFESKENAEAFESALKEKFPE